MIMHFIIVLAAMAPTRAIDLSTTPLYSTEPYPSFAASIASNTTYNGSNGASTGTDTLTQEQSNAAHEQPIAFQANTSCTIDSFIQGFGFDDNNVENGFYNIPPDPSGAAGAARLVAVVNVMIEVRTKAGVLTYRDGLKDFFAVLGTSQAGSNLFDPKVVYDEHAQRFVVVGLQSDFTTLSRVLLAVSKNELPDTVNDWYMYAINSVVSIGGVSSWADYPGFEVDEEAVYFAANMFSFSTGTFQASRLWIIDKGVNGGFYSGGPTVVLGPFDPYQSFGIATTTMPAQIHGSGGAGTSIGTYLVSNLRYNDGSIVVQIITVQNPLVGVTFTLNQVNLGIISQSSIPKSPQLGSAVVIDASDGRTLDAVWRNNKLWMTLTINPLPPDIDANQTTAHWVRIDTSTFTLEAQGNLGGEAFSPQTSTSFPAVALNSQGQVAFGYAASSPTMYIGAYGSIFVGGVEQPFIVKSGLDYYVRIFDNVRNRWGDYTGISVDPTDDSFWIFNQFANVRGSAIFGDGRWGTAWARVQCTASSAPTKAPTKSPTKAPTKVPTKIPTKSPTKAPTQTPTEVPTSTPVAPPTNCGLFGLNFFCPRHGECGFLRRMFNIGGC